MSTSNTTLEGYLELHSKIVDPKSSNPQLNSLTNLKAKLYDFSAVDSHENTSSRKISEKKPDYCPIRRRDRPPA